jgi:hypothetical protein
MTWRLILFCALTSIGGLLGAHAYDGHFTLAAESRMTTVLGSMEDVAASGYKNVPGYNALERPAGMTDAEFGRYNAEWMNTAFQRGDAFMAVTDPAAHEAMLESIQQGLSFKSNYLKIELPMLEQFGATVPTQVSVPPVVPFYFSR